MTVAINKVGVIGSGQMGNGIAHWANIGLSAKWRSCRDTLLIGADGVPELHRQHNKANN